MLKDKVHIKFESNNNRSLAVENGNIIGECEFYISDNKWVITHTGVRTNFEGQGIAKRLVECIIEKARENKVKILPICSYAKEMMVDKSEYSDVLVSE